VKIPVYGSRELRMAIKDIYKLTKGVQRPIKVRNISYRMMRNIGILQRTNKTAYLRVVVICDELLPYEHIKEISNLNLESWIKHDCDYTY